MIFTAAGASPLWISSVPRNGDRALEETGLLYAKLPRKNLFLAMTDDPQLSRSMLIVLVILAILFGALLLLVGHYRRGHVSRRPEATDAQFLKRIEEHPGRRLCRPINNWLAFDLPVPHRPVDAAGAEPELTCDLSRAHALG